MKSTFLSFVAALALGLLHGCGPPPNYHDPRNSPADCPAEYPITSATPVACSTDSTCWYGNYSCNPSCRCPAGDAGTRTWFCAACD